MPPQDVPMPEAGPGSVIMFQGSVFRSVYYTYLVFIKYDSWWVLFLRKVHFWVQKSLFEEFGLRLKHQLFQHVGPFSLTFNNFGTVDSEVGSFFKTISDETCCCHFYVKVHGQNTHFHFSLLQNAVKGSPLLCRWCRQESDPALFLYRSHECTFLVTNDALGLWYAEWKGYISCNFFSLQLKVAKLSRCALILLSRVQTCKVCEWQSGGHMKMWILKYLYFK